MTLISGAQSKNVFWMVDGAVSINNNSIFRGNIVVSSGAINIVNTGITLDGRALTKIGTITTTAMKVTIPSVCSATNVPSFDAATDAVTIYPNPFNGQFIIQANDNQLLVISIY